MWRALLAAIFGRKPSVSLHPEGVPQRDASSIAPATATPRSSIPGADREVVFLPGTGRGYFLEVTGESGYQDVLSGQWQKMRPNRETSMRLTAEPMNPSDSKAVAVQTLTGETVGYLSAAEAASYQQLILQLDAQQLIGICKAKLLGGTANRTQIGVFLDVEPPTLVASKLGLTIRV